MASWKRKYENQWRKWRKMKMKSEYQWKMTNERKWMVMKIMANGMKRSNGENNSKRKYESVSISVLINEKKQLWKINNEKQ